MLLLLYYSSKRKEIARGLVTGSFFKFACWVQLYIQPILFLGIIFTKQAEKMVCEYQKRQRSPAQRQSPFLLLSNTKSILVVTLNADPSHLGLLKFYVEWKIKIERGHKCQVIWMCENFRMRMDNMFLHIWMLDVHCFFFFLCLRLCYVGLMMINRCRIDSKNPP